MPVQVVEAADLVRAVVRAVARADAAVVRHLVEALGPVRRGVDRADVLARRLFAVHARERLVDGERVFGGGVQLRVLDPVAVDAEPVHLAAAPDFELADDRHVVLGHAGDDARVAARARVEVDRHAPLVTLAVVLLVPEGQRAQRGRVELGEVRPLLVVGQRRLVRDGPALGRAVLLRLGEEVRVAAGLRHLRAARSRGPPSCGSGRRRTRARCRCGRRSCGPSRASARSSCRPGRAGPTRPR